ncbi:prealbumin-like fold domain-containing protein, partial (plasmid) [Clostridium perfringens]
DAKSNEELSFIFDKNNKVFILDKSNNGNTILSPIKGENSFLIKDLSYGDYILTEVKSPEGYLKDKDIYIHLSEKSSYYSLGKDGEKIKLNLDNQIFTISVENTKGIIIPDTGGNGFYLPKKYLFIILSISIILIINFLLINTRRKKNG